jgi:hypothetical protein
MTREADGVGAGQRGAVRGRLREVSAEVVQNGCAVVTGRATFLDGRAGPSFRRHGDAPCSTTLSRTTTPTT